MAFIIPIYKFSIAGQVQFGAYLKGMTFNVDYPTLSEIFNIIHKTLVENINDLDYRSSILKIFYNHPLDQDYFYFWNKETKISFEEKLNSDIGRSIINTEPVYKIYLQDISQLPHIFWEVN